MTYNNISNSLPQTELEHNVLKRINNLEKEMEEVKSKIETTKQTTVENMLVTKFEPLEFWEGTTAAPTTTTRNKSVIRLITKEINQINNKSVASITIPNTQSSTKAIKDHVTQSIMTNNLKKPTTLKTINTYASINNVTKKPEVNTTAAVNLNQNISFSEESNHILTGLANDNTTNDDMGKDMDLEELIKKYNPRPSPGKAQPFNYNKFLQNSAIPGDKENANEDMMEKDMKKLMAERPKDSNEMANPFQDTKGFFDLMRH